MIGHQGEHVVLDVIVHVPIQEAVDAVHIDRPAVEPMIEHILGEAGVLGVGINRRQPCPVKLGKPDEHQRQQAALIDGQADDRRIDQQANPGAPEGLAILGFRDVGLLLRREPACAMKQHVPEVERNGPEAEESQQQPEDIRRAGNRNLRIAPDDDGVTVVAHVAPAPGHRLPHHHEGGDLVKRVVHPVSLEGRAVAGFVPAGIRGGGVEHAVDHEGDDRPPASGLPKRVAAHPGADQQREPDDGVADGRPVPPFEQLAHLLFGNRRGVPRGFRQTFLQGADGVVAHQAVISLLLQLP